MYHGLRLIGEIIEVDEVYIPITIFINELATQSQEDIIYPVTDPMAGMYRNYEAIITDAWHQAADEEACFRLLIYKGLPNSILDRVYPEYCDIPNIRGTSLIKLADKLNNIFGIEKCWLTDSPGIKFCNMNIQIPMSVLFLLADGKNWYMRHGYKYLQDTTIQRGLAQLACLRKLPSTIVFLPNYGLDFMLDKGTSVGDAFWQLRLDLYSGNECDHIPVIEDRLFTLGNVVKIWALLNMVKDYSDTTVMYPIHCSKYDIIDPNLIAALNNMTVEHVLNYYDNDTKKYLGWI